MSRLDAESSPRRRDGRPIRELAQFSLRSLPFVRGKHRLVHYLAPALGDLPSPAYAKLVNGSKILIDETTGVDFWYLGVYEPDVTPVLLNQLRRLAPERSFVDLGANVGYFSVIAAHEMRGRGGQVFSFEPHPKARAALTANVEFNGLSNVTIEGAAVSDSTGTGSIHGSEISTSLSSLLPVHEGLEPVASVPTTRLDEYFEGRPEITIGLIKSDIQGGELPALRGGEELLRRDRPVLIIEEWPFGTDAFGYSITDLKRYLRSLGYELSLITEGRVKWSVVNVVDSDEPDVGPGREHFANLLCTPTDL